MIDKSELKDVMNVIRDDDEDDEENEEEEETDNKKEKSLKTKLPSNFDDSNENKPLKKAKKQKNSEKKTKYANTDEISDLKVPEKNIQVSTINISSAMTEAKQVMQNNREKNESHNLTISEAFADDDVIEQFKAEKVRFLRY